MHRGVRWRWMTLLAVPFVVGSLMAGALEAQEKKPAEKKEAAKKPDATLKLSEGSVAAGIGFSWGKGMLSYKGKQYPFKVEGLSVGEVGVTRVEANGKVSSLKKLEDFSGNYAAAGAQGTVGGGAGATIMKNQNGVVVELISTTQGVNIKLAAEGVKLTLEKK